MANQLTYTVAVVGATGAVGQQMIKILEERDFPIKQLKLLASGRSAGKTVRFKGQDVVVEEATPDSFAGVDFALFSAGGAVSKELAHHAVRHGAVVIDNTSAFRMDPDVPLVVPEVNMEAAFKHKGIIANPNCSTIQMVAALKPLYDRYGIDRIIVSTYQAVSGAGASAIQELLTQTRDVLDGKQPECKVLPVGKLPVHHPIAFNAIPQIDVFTDNGFTYEEMKMVNETKKILGDDSVLVSATCVRIPVVYGHSEAVYVELKQDYDLDEVKSLLEQAPGIVLVDQPEEQRYPLATDAAGKLDVFVGRVRRDLHHPRGLHMWIVSDNLLKGAAWNTVQIAEELIKARA
ncbi:MULTISPECIES: aspartate-semialdehyde dehydrogenase [Brevibacillus]|jgi:aspartate-semialdehyde dehydrogenase|uniref:Aspartate-semialdehyde dehydrogenase n=1 Tax=Brevibacillus aydinogluensis TaxID=927786 RepID=A0AA48M917_9BACL|nr:MULTISPECIES: aspartate-semialdehyde dehydrogenase [Brevibacillus]REK64157.1 MAG: aspartate-semialdehyde dehydrogenase [Brevibacillus sp.]MBR8659436.1 aspartate-semialdehyde dehydrogenase [Brevibacillus sp. NL20B1]MDT3414966.1 aspartate-semialdehyde dehydrogenase [Brevibacillus aydinogluensis]NNV01861.1 aspartate-semialdehyde dehydrogenase [Brevibacillus sp. MCWH]CAJ1002492.1 aspartate-semialdehyde dehydrogenase [Brevibacillus aydinogluensis]